MTVKVMYISYQPYFLDLAKEMEKDEWDPFIGPWFLILKKRSR